jgi:hypothetical protein
VRYLNDNHGIRKAKSIKVVTKIENSQDYVLMMYSEAENTGAKYLHMHRQFMYKLIDELNATGKMTLPELLTNTEKVIEPTGVRFFESAQGYITRDAHVAWVEGEEEEPKDVMASLEWTDWQKAWYDKQIQDISDRAQAYGFKPWNKK